MNQKFKHQWFEEVWFLRKKYFFDWKKYFKTGFEENSGGREREKDEIGNYLKRPFIKL